MTISPMIERVSRAIAKARGSWYADEGQWIHCEGEARAAIEAIPVPILYVVGEHRGDLPWAFCGAFDSVEAAIHRCTTPTHFYGPVALNQAIPEQTMEWPGMVYPMVEA